MNPYLVLAVPRDADDQTIRRAYLEAIKVATPETDPGRFKELASAYEKIKDEARRNEYELFNTESPGESPLDVFVRYHELTPGLPPLSFEGMKEFLRACAKT